MVTVNAMIIERKIHRLILKSVVSVFHFQFNARAQRQRDREIMRERENIINSADDFVYVFRNQT